MQYDELSHSTLKPSPRPSSEISTFGRPAPLLGRLLTVALRDEGGRCLFVSMETNLGQTVCLGKGCERHTSPSNQLESYAETAWLGLG